MEALFIDQAEKQAGTPEMGNGCKCDKPGCNPDEHWETCFGMAGGGMGIYSYCHHCQRVTEKTCESEDA